MRSIILTLRTLSSIALVALAVPFLWATVSGDYYMTVTGVSMQPTYEVGDVLVVQAPKGDELQTPGKPVVVSFSAGDTSDQYVHRVETVTEDGAILKGDGNEVSDPLPVTQEQVLGTPRFALQGTWATLFRMSELWAVRLIVGAVFLIALFVPSKRKDRSATAGPAEASAERADDATEAERVLAGLVSGGQSR
ncbi:signal peptidase I [Leucobacter komagatae]|uniref:Signal peptidase I n=1 Tax=Leucobacter komagatae TaxID=55969 RepID=A0A542Y5V0_9MICO|nr:S24 family peptidase [Leucobacter komagatae]TQL43436.1 signal peptidase I [Leucobacter komagatae]